MALRLTHVGTACVLLEIDVPGAAPVRLLTDPVFDPPGRRYHFGWGTSSTKVEEPALPATRIGPLDAVLLSHDQHADNLDDAGRTFLAGVPRVVTTRRAARRLGGVARGLVPWEALQLGPVSVTATPARHGPPLSLPFAGPVIGFLLEWPGQAHGAFYVSGDTVVFGGALGIGGRVKVGTALLHMGRVRFPAYGPVRFTMGGQGAARLAGALGARTVVPVHYAGWTHFQEGRAEIERAFGAAGLAERLRWAELGVPLELEA